MLSRKPVACIASTVLIAPCWQTSGGFQVFSLAGIRNSVKKERVPFTYWWQQAYLHSGKVMDIERTIGADIMMAFDECPPGDSDYAYAKKSLGWHTDGSIVAFSVLTKLNRNTATISLSSPSYKDVFIRICVSNPLNSSPPKERMAMQSADWP